VSAAGLLGGVGRSLLSAWTPRPEGPGWAPWAWTAAINTLVALALTLFVPRTGGLGANLLVSHSIGFTIHAFFAGLGHGLRFDMFTLPGRLRAAYVLSVVLAGSWIGYAGATWMRLGDAGLVAAHLGRASGFLLAIPSAWALLTMLLFAGVDRLRGQQLARERERRERADAQRELIAARLQLLSAQIEPHFLYNTLAGVSALMQTDPPGAQRLLEALVAYLRSSSRNMTSSLVTLAQELESVHGYLDVMQLRLGARLLVRYSVPPQAESLRMPPASLLTLVENAVKHGIEPSRKGGSIEVRALPVGAGWALEVEDDGQGPGVAGLAQASGGKGLAQASGGTGLANLGERLRLALGEGAGVVLEAGPRGGALARMSLPGAAGG
jgi:signal transduction histidine kinase